MVGPTAADAAAAGAFATPASSIAAATAINFFFAPQMAIEPPIHDTQTSRTLTRKKRLILSCLRMVAQPIG
jgi:hypothetical protein